MKYLLEDKMELFGKILIVSLVLFICSSYIAHGFSTGKKWWKLFLSPVLFPLLLFIYGYFVPPTEIPLPVILYWQPDLSFFVTTLIIITALLVVNLSLFFYSPMRFVNTMTEQAKREIIKGKKSSFFLAFWAALRISSFAGLTEEITFRYVFQIALAPIISWICATLPVGAVSGSLPFILTLGVSDIAQPAALMTFLILNVYFAGVHILNKEGEVDWALWYRPIGAWYIGWLSVYALIQFGLLGAILTHTVVNLSVMTVLFFLISRRIIEDASRMDFVGDY